MHRPQEAVQLRQIKQLMYAQHLARNGVDPATAAAWQNASPYVMSNPAMYHLEGYPNAPWPNLSPYVMRNAAMYHSMEGHNAGAIMASVPAQHKPVNYTPRFDPALTEENVMKGMSEEEYVMALMNGSINVLPQHQQNEFNLYLLSKKTNLVMPIPRRDAKMPKKRSARRYIYQRDYMKKNINFRMLSFLSNFPLLQVPSGSEKLALLPCRKCKSGSSTPDNVLMACKGRCGQTYHQKCYGLVVSEQNNFYCRKDSCQQVRIQEESRRKARERQKPRTREDRSRRRSTAGVTSVSSFDHFSPNQTRDSQPVIPHLKTFFDVLLYLERFFDPLLLQSSRRLLEVENLDNLFQVPLIGDRSTLPQDLAGLELVEGDFDAKDNSIVRKSISLSVRFLKDYHTPLVHITRENRNSLTVDDDVLANRRFLALRMVNCDYSVAVGICQEDEVKYDLNNYYFGYLFPPSPYTGISGRFLDPKSVMSLADASNTEAQASPKKISSFVCNSTSEECLTFPSEDGDEICSELWLLRNELGLISKKNSQRKQILKQRIHDSLINEELVEAARSKKLEIIHSYINLASNSPWSTKSKEDLALSFDCYKASREKLYALSRYPEEEKEPPVRRRSSVSKATSSVTSETLLSSSRPGNFDREIPKSLISKYKDIFVQAEDLLVQLDKISGGVDDCRSTLLRKYEAGQESSLHSDVSSPEVNDYCICRSNRISPGFYQSCYFCQNWFHGDCINFMYSDLVDKFICSKCEDETGLSTTFVKIEPESKRETRSSQVKPKFVSSQDRFYLKRCKARFHFNGEVSEKVYGFLPCPERNGECETNFSSPNDDSKSTNLKLVLRLPVDELNVEKDEGIDCRSLRSQRRKSTSGDDECTANSLRRSKRSRNIQADS